MIKVYVNVKQTPDSNAESHFFQDLQRFHNTGKVTLALQHTQVSTVHRIPMLLRIMSI